MFCLLCSKVTKHLISLQNIRSSSCSQVIGRSSSTTSASGYSFESQNELRKGEVLFSAQIYSISQSMVRSTWLQVLTLSKCEDMNPSSSDHSYILLSLFQALGQLGRDRRAVSGREKGVDKRSIGEKEGRSRELSFPRPFLFLYQTPLVASFRSRPLF